MAITDLTGTIWKFNQLLNLGSTNISYTIDYYINSPGYQFVELYLKPNKEYQSDSENDLSYFDEDGEGETSYSEHVWYPYGEIFHDPDTIFITGGDDVTNSALISWLSANATQLSSSDVVYWAVDTSTHTLSLSSTSISGTYSGSFYKAINFGYYHTPWVRYASDIYTVNIVNAIELKYASHLFSFLTQCTSITNIHNLNLSNATHMDDMFAESKFTSLDLSSFNTSSMVSMRSVFSNCTSLTSLNVSNFNTSNVLTMSALFSDCNALTSLDVSNFDTSKVKVFYSMFNSCSNLTSLNLDNFNISAATDLSYMLAGCEKLTNINVLNFNTENVKTMQYMFSGCVGLTSLDLSNFYTPVLANVNNMFSGATKLSKIYVSNLWDVSHVKAGYMGNYTFNNCSNLSGAIAYDSTKTDYTYANYNNGYLTYKASSISTIYWALKDYKLYLSNTAVSGTYSGSFSGAVRFNAASELPWYSYIEDYGIESAIVVNRIQPRYTSYLFAVLSDCSLIENISNIDMSKVIFADHMFYESGLTELDVSSFDTSNVQDMSFMFSGLSNLTSFNMNNLNTSNVRDMTGMFFRFSRVVRAGHFDTSKVTSMSQMFSYCPLDETSLTNFNTSNVTDMSFMFHSLITTEALDLSNFDTSKVTTMHNMFGYSTTLQEINLSSFDVSNVSDMSQMFHMCSALKTLDLSNFKTSALTNASLMFCGARQLTTIYASELWDNSKITTSGSMFLQCTSLKGAISYDVNKVNATYANYTTGYFTYKAPVRPKIYWGITGNILTLSSIEVSGTYTGHFAADTQNIYQQWATYADSITNIYISDEIWVIYPAAMFKNLTNLTTINNLENINLSMATDLSYMFENCSSLTTGLDKINQWTAENVTNLTSMFKGCSSLAQIPDLSNLTNVTTFDDCFNGCTNIAGTLTLSSKLTSWNDCLAGTTNPIILKGNPTVAEEIKQEYPNAQKYLAIDLTTAKTSYWKPLAGELKQVQKVYFSSKLIKLFTPKFTYKLNDSLSSLWSGNVSFKCADGNEYTGMTWISLGSNYYLNYLNGDVETAVYREVSGVQTWNNEAYRSIFPDFTTMSSSFKTWLNTNAISLLPSSGSIIKLKNAAGVDQNYIVLSIEPTTGIAELMTQFNIGETYKSVGWDYFGSNLDTKIQEWVETLPISNMIKTVGINDNIISDNTGQYTYEYNWSGSYRDLKVNSVKDTQLRKAFAPSIDDIYNSIESSNITSTQLNQMFFGSATAVSDVVWIRDSYPSDPLQTPIGYYVNGSTGAFGGGLAEDLAHYRACFYVNLTEIDYTT